MENLVCRSFFPITCSQGHVQQVKGQTGVDITGDKYRQDREKGMMARRKEGCRLRKEAPCGAGSHVLKGVQESGGPSSSPLSADLSWLFLEIQGKKKTEIAWQGVSLSCCSTIEAMIVSLSRLTIRPQGLVELWRRLLVKASSPGSDGLAVMGVE